MGLHTLQGVRECRAEGSENICYVTIFIEQYYTPYANH